MTIFVDLHNLCSTSISYAKSKCHYLNVYFTPRLISPGRRSTVVSFRARMMGMQCAHTCYKNGCMAGIVDSIFV